MQSSNTLIDNLTERVQRQTVGRLIQMYVSKIKIKEIGTKTIKKILHATETSQHLLSSEDIDKVEMLDSSASVEIKSLSVCIA